MTLATRFNVLFLLCALLLAGILAWMEMRGGYRQSLDNFSLLTSAKLQSRPEVQFYLHQNNARALKRVLSEILKASPAEGAIVYDALGNELARMDKPASAGAGEPAGFSKVRSNASPISQAYVAIGSDQQARAPGLYQSIIDDFPPLYLSVPVLSLVNPALEEMTGSRLGEALARGGEATSNWVIGYVHFFGKSRPLFDVAWFGAARFLLMALGVVLLCQLLCAYFVRRITRPLREVCAAAQRMANGDFSQTLRVDATGEIGEIALKIDSIRSSMATQSASQNIIQRSLNQKVEEREREISARDTALVKAEEDASQRRKMMHRLANYDRLTHLPNRQLFNEQLNILLCMEERSESQLALLLIDFKDYEQINETMGVGAGDQVMREVARRLSASIREEHDSPASPGRQQIEIAVSRLGGAEFGVVLQDMAGIEAIRTVVERILAVLSTPLQVENRSLHIQPRIGIALAPDHGDSVESLLRAAGIARANTDEKSRDEAALFYTRDMSAAADRRKRMETDLRKAVENSELALHYQPQIDLNSGSVVGAEAFLRWQHSELGAVPPGDIIQLAEEAGFIDDLGDWILQEACRQVQYFNNEGVRLPRVAINVSALQFNARFARQVMKVVAEQAIPPSQLELALTESIMTCDLPDTMDALNTLKKSGVYISIDDFGSGHTALSYLGRFPLDELKISRNFVRETDDNNEGASKLVAGLVSMGRALELQVSATGVETPWQLEFLRDCGADLAQGYLFSKPVPPADLRPMLAPWHFIRQLQELAITKSGQRIA